ncbi:hypothetical protein YH66_05355 [[Brevibacterium] flavum]|uniref:Uncharacterized protein n=1 Tax=[Brevibacterium] flavum TaxID=92706 RepID=A0A0F6Z5X2_9CORY|nr:MULTISPECIES: hypothetical protein [Corynebacterium]AKF27021.1 hypothetical protein YH66_05355 [[Brevibacterium] flavum]ANE07844.1 hypothetical protein A3654_05340 [Corynebacterium glutamicum]AST20261.1 hypothetical protein CEY17_05410 [Corynebacterium glutamicum ATCC 14067]KEI22737.1 hypothetical protein KIQ_009195 [Corynebacterium glutamicum ATCC 14067]KIH74274.1 hypothetical protein SD36_05375 [Corynebacterium glutamicum]
MTISKKYEELERLTDELAEINYVVLEDDEHGNPRMPSEAQRERSRELIRQQREILRELKELEN